MPEDASPWWSQRIYPTGSGRLDRKRSSLDRAGPPCLAAACAACDHLRPVNRVLLRTSMALAGHASSFESRGGPAAPVVLAAAAAGLVDFIEMQGGDADEIFGACGIAPDMITAPTLQLRLDVFCKLFEQAAQRTGCDNFGLLFGQQFQPRDLGMWGYAALSAPTLGSALETLADLFVYQQSSSTMRLRRVDEKPRSAGIPDPDALHRRATAGRRAVAGPIHQPHPRVLRPQLVADRDPVRAPAPGGMAPARACLRGTGVLRLLQQRDHSRDRNIWTGRCRDAISNCSP